MISQCITLVTLIYGILTFTALMLFSYLEAWYRVFVPVEPKSLSRDTILVTGAGAGIGREICLNLANSGAKKIVCWDINKSDNENTVAELIELGVQAYAYEIDISQRSQVETLAEKVRREAGDITIIINNAGIMAINKFLDHNPTVIERTFQVNLFAHFWILKAFLPRMIEMNRGHIVTVCSIAGLIGTRNSSIYSASKYAVNGFIESLNDEMENLPEKPDIKFTTVYPYAVNTGLLHNVGVCKSRFESLIPIQDPKIVADRLVDGMRRNYEQVFVPGIIKSLADLRRSMYPRVRPFATNFMKAYVDPKSNRD